MAKPVIDARQALADIRSGMSDSVLMKKYSLSAKGLQSLLNKLVSEGLIDKSVFDRDRGASATARREVSAKDVVDDLRSGVTDEELMDKFRLSAKGLDNLFEQLVETGLIQAHELEERTEVGTHGTVDLRKEGFEDIPPPPMPTRAQSDKEIAIPEEVKGTPQVRPADRIEPTSQITANASSSVADSLFMPIMPDAQTFFSKQEAASSATAPKPDSSPGPGVDSKPSPAPIQPALQPESESRDVLEPTLQISEEKESEPDIQALPEPEYSPPPKRVEETIELTDIPESGSTTEESPPVPEADQSAETTPTASPPPTQSGDEHATSTAVPPVQEAAPTPGDTVILAGSSEATSEEEDRPRDDSLIAPLEYEPAPTADVADAGEQSEPELEPDEEKAEIAESEAAAASELVATAVEEELQTERETVLPEAQPEPETSAESQVVDTREEEEPEHAATPEEPSEAAAPLAIETNLPVGAQDDEAGDGPETADEEPQPALVSFTPPEKVAEEIATTDFLEVDDGDSEASDPEIRVLTLIKPDPTISETQADPAEPGESPSQTAGDEESEKPIWKCPYCGYFQKTDFNECPRCGKARELAAVATTEKVAEQEPPKRIVEPVVETEPTKEPVRAKSVRRPTPSPELQAFNNELAESVKEMDSARLWLTTLSTVVAWLGAIQLMAVMSYVGVQLLKMPFSPGGITYSKVVELVIVPALISVGIMIVVQAMANGLRVGAQLLRNVALGNRLMAKIIETIDKPKD